MTSMKDVYKRQVTPISKTVGAARISGAQAIPYPTGDPNLPPEKEEARQTEIAVSYTHLDVYKRQLYGSSTTGGNISTVCIRAVSSFIL